MKSRSSVHLARTSDRLLFSTTLLRFKQVLIDFQSQLIMSYYVESDSDDDERRVIKLSLDEAHPGEAILEYRLDSVPGVRFCGRVPFSELNALQLEELLRVPLGTNLVEANLESFSNAAAQVTTEESMWQGPTASVSPDPTMPTSVQPERVSEVVAKDFVCNICLVPLPDLCSSAVQLKVTECGHVFCKICMKKLVVAEGHVNVRCCVCRHNLFRNGQMKVFDLHF